MTREATQNVNLQTIISQVMNEGRSIEYAFVAGWVAYTESSLGINNQGRGTISGVYQYRESTWQERQNLYIDPMYSYRQEFIGFDWSANRNTLEGQLKVFLADMRRYQSELNTLINGGPEAEALLRDPQISKAWPRMQ